MNLYQKKSKYRNIPKKNTRNYSEQECIPVGCIPSAVVVVPPPPLLPHTPSCHAHPPATHPEGGYAKPRGVCLQGAYEGVGQTSPPREQND